MSRFFKACAAGLTVALMGLASLPAQATVTSTFLFSSLCQDCVDTSEGSTDSASNHPVSATLVLNGENFGYWQTFGLKDFVSFTYGGSNLLKSFTITNSQAAFFDATYYDDGHINMEVKSDSYYFWANNIGETNGWWDAGRIFSADFGWDVTWQKADLTNNIPEPATMLLVGAALAGLGLSRRRRQA